MGLRLENSADVIRKAIWFVGRGYATLILSVGAKFLSFFRTAEPTKSCCRAAKEERSENDFSWTVKECDERIPLRVAACCSGQTGRRSKASMKSSQFLLQRTEEPKPSRSFLHGTLQSNKTNPREPFLNRNETIKESFCSKTRKMSEFLGRDQRNQLE